MNEARIWHSKSGFQDADPWHAWEEGASVNKDTVVPLPAFLALGSAVRANVRAVQVEPADDVTALTPYLGALDLIAINFPAFNDGRGFSHATVLRGRDGFHGEIRAVGDVLIDKIAYMLRCGFDSVAVTNVTAIARLEQGDLADVPLYYQPAAKAAAVEGKYSWRRKPAA